MEDWRNEFPLYPPLNELAAKEAQELLNGFKEQMLKVCKEVLSQIYCDVVTYIETDSWTIFRNEVIQGFSKYGNRKLQGKYDFDRIREAIFREHREEIIKECQEDIVKENESLKKELKMAREYNRRY